MLKRNRRLELLSISGLLKWMEMDTLELVFKTENNTLFVIVVMDRLDDENSDTHVEKEGYVCRKCVSLSS